MSPGPCLAQTRSGRTLTPCPFPLRLCRASTRGGLLLSLHVCRKVSQQDRAVSWAVQTLPSAARSIFSNRAILSCPCARLLAEPCSPQLRFTPSPLLPHRWCCRPSPGLQGSMWGHLVYGNPWILHMHPVRPGEGRAPAAQQEGGHGEPPAPAAGSLLAEPSAATGGSARSQPCRPAVRGSRLKWQRSSAQLSSQHRSKVPKDISVQPAGAEAPRTQPHRAPCQGQDRRRRVAAQPRALLPERGG